MALSPPRSSVHLTLQGTVRRAPSRADLHASQEAVDQYSPGPRLENIEQFAVGLKVCVRPVYRGGQLALERTSQRQHFVRAVMGHHQR